MILLTNLEIENKKGGGKLETYFNSIFKISLILLMSKVK